MLGVESRPLQGEEFDVSQIFLSGSLFDRRMHRCGWQGVSGVSVLCQPEERLSYGAFLGGPLKQSRGTGPTPPPRMEISHKLSGYEASLPLPGNRLRRTGRVNSQGRSTPKVQIYDTKMRPNRRQQRGGRLTMGQKSPGGILLKSGCLGMGKHA